MDGGSCGPWGFSLARQSTAAHFSLWILEPLCRSTREMLLCTYLLPNFQFPITVQHSSLWQRGDKWAATIIWHITDTVALAAMVKAPNFGSRPQEAPWSRFGCQLLCIWPLHYITLHYGVSQGGRVIKVYCSASQGISSRSSLAKSPGTGSLAIWAEPSEITGHEFWLCKSLACHWLQKLECFTCTSLSLLDSVGTWLIGTSSKKYALVDGKNFGKVHRTIAK